MQRGWAWTSEKKLPARGVKFYFIIKQDIPEKERAAWQEAVSRSSPLSKWFGRVQFKYWDDHPTLISDWQGWNLIKIFCQDAHTSMKPSEVISSYKDIFMQFSDWFIKRCRERRIECKPYDFRILFRLRPPETAGEFVPIPTLNDISRRVVSPPSILPDPPTTPEAGFALAEKVFSGQQVAMLLEWAEKDKSEVYVGYGVRTEQGANTYELDTVFPDLSEEIEAMRSLQGALEHVLILQAQGKAPPDFNNIVEALLMKLLQNGVIDSMKVEHIYNNPGDYFEATEWRTRFMLKFDLKSTDLTGERGRALDSVKKDVQRQLQDTTYSLFGVFSYTLADEDLTRMEAVRRNIVYFRNAKPDELFINLSVILVGHTYDRIVEIARETDKVLNTSPATDIEDAKKRWNSAVSDCVRDGRKVASFIFFKQVSGLPFQVFTAVQESLYKELNKIAGETHITAILTSDNQARTRYGCYVFPQ